MWEFCIAFDDETQAQNFRKSIISDIKSLQGVVTVLVSITFAKVLIAVPNDVKTKAKEILIEKIAENILLYNKKRYILSKLNFDITHSTSMQVFLKALVVFDSDTDKEIIIERLDLQNDIVVKSFVDFRLTFLKRKWDELVSLANDNAMYLVSEDTFGELIKFLISNLEYRCYAVNVFSKKNCYLLCDTQGKVINDFLIERNIVYDDNMLITSLIALNPEKIIVHCNSFVKDKLLKTLYEYFSNRLEVCK